MEFQPPYLGLCQLHGLLELRQPNPKLFAGHQALRLLVLVARPLDLGFIYLCCPPRDLLLWFRR